jgi:hypothetical protein
MAHLPSFTDGRWVLIVEMDSQRDYCLPDRSIRWLE